MEVGCARAWGLKLQTQPKVVEQPNTLPSIQPSQKSHPPNIGQLGTTGSHIEAQGSAEVYFLVIEVIITITIAIINIVMIITPQRYKGYHRDGGGEL